LPPEDNVRDFASGGSFVASDRYGQYYARRQFLGNVRVHPDRSAAMIVPGGVPITLQSRVALAADSSATIHHQREEMQFYPGENSRQSFREEFFAGLCGGCHGSVSGLEMDIAVKPDILTSASRVVARDATADDLTTATGLAPEGPPFP
jgi:hypothetical protein